MIERGDAGTHRQGISGERAGLIDRTERSDAIHDGCAAAIGSYRQTAADNFSECSEIGLDAEEVLYRTVPQPETGDDFVHDQKCAVSAS